MGMHELGSTLAWVLLLEGRVRLVVGNELLSGLTKVDLVLNEGGPDP